jgi:hypothetical protein
MFMVAIKIIYIETVLIDIISHSGHSTPYDYQKGLPMPMPMPIMRRGGGLSSGSFSAPPISLKMLPISLSKREFLSFLCLNMNLHVNELTANVLLYILV